MKIVSTLLTFYILLLSTTANATILHFRADLSDSSTPGTQPFFTGGAGTVEQLLIDTGLNNPNFESAAEFFTVGGTGLQSLTFKKEQDTGTFNALFGFFDMALVNGLDPSSAEFVEAATSDFTEVFWDETDPVGTTKTFEILGGTELGFILFADTGSNVDPEGNIFFGQEAANEYFPSPLGADRMLAFTGNNKTLFTFEDHTTSDYTDLAFSINTSLIADDVEVSGPVNASAPATGMIFAIPFALLLLRNKKK